MKIQRSTVTKLLVTEIKALDPLSVILEDLGPRQGKIIIECYGKSWSAYWGAMGDRTIAEFFLSCNADYIIGNLSSIRSHRTKINGYETWLKSELIGMRRKREFDSDIAREIWRSIEDETDDHGCDPSRLHNGLMVTLFGDDWWSVIPDEPNPDYEYLERIVMAAQEGIKMMIEAKS